MKDIITLSIESSCDETAVAVLKNGREVLANVVSTQIELHKKFGGVVPEVASRKHIENIDAVYQEALDTAGIKPEEIDHIAVTYGPGLVGALLVGLSYAKALAFTLGVPLVGVNHMQGHITNVAVHSNYRGQRIGDRLVEEMVKLCKSEGLVSMTLEVRSSNTIAQNLYRKYGFKMAGVRKEYYSDREDAIIMWNQLSEL